MAGGLLSQGILQVLHIIPWLISVTKAVGRDGSALSFLSALEHRADELAMGEPT